MGRQCRTNGEKRNAYKILDGTAERKRPLGRPRCMYVDDMKMGGMHWICLAVIGTSGGLL
jgi:hypothetical protein